LHANKIKKPHLLLGVIVLKMMGLLVKMIYGKLGLVIEGDGLNI
jgi:hypothetical protein